MRRTPLILAALLLASCAKAPVSPTTPPGTAAISTTAQTDPAQASRIEGNVVGHDGKPLRLAHVRLLGTGESKAPEVKVADDGSFSIAVPKPGLAKVEITGVDHEQTALTVIVGPEPLKLDVKLGTYDRPDTIDALTAIMWTGDPHKSAPERKPLTKNDAGVYTTELKTDAERVFYQIAGHAGGRTTNGPVSDAFAYDGGGDYRSIVLPSAGKVVITVDVTKLVPGGKQKVLTFGDPAGPSARLLAVADAKQAAHDAFQAVISTKKPGTPQEFQALAKDYDWAAPRSTMLAMLSDEENPQVRRVILGAYFELGDFDPETASADDRARAEELIGDLDATDPGWGLFAESLVVAIELSDDPRRTKKLDAMLDAELPPALGARILFTRLSELSTGNAADPDKAREAFARLQKPRFAKTPFFFFSKQFDPDRAIKKGGKLPDFELTAIKAKRERGPKKLSNEDLTGSVTLVDLWATWCKPCVADMDNLHAAYDKYNTKRKPKKGERQFQILSISLDKSTEEVAEFRKDRFPMPWRHAHMSFDGASELFGVFGIPYAVLLDENGTIIETSPRLSGATLGAMLDDVLAQPRAEAE